MAQKDMVEKTLEAHNDVFADIVNVLLFQGERYVKEESLLDAVTHSVYKADGKLREQERDVAKYLDKSMIRIAFFGIENQTEPEKEMPLRVISYDGAAYRVQLQREKRRRRGAKGKKKQSMPKYYPVITLVLYFGYEKHWDKACNLKGCLEIPRIMLPYVNDYTINLFEIAWLTDEQVASFQSDFRIVADYFVQMRKNKNYVPSKETIQHVDEIFRFMAAMTQDRRFEEYNSIADEDEGGVNMCNTFDEYWNRGLEQGRTEGIEEKRKLNLLYGMLLDAGRLEDLRQAIADNDFCEKLMQELLPA